MLILELFKCKTSAVKLMQGFSSLDKSIKADSLRGKSPTSRRLKFRRDEIFFIPEKKELSMILEIICKRKIS